MIVAPAVHAHDVRQPVAVEVRGHQAVRLAPTGNGEPSSWRNEAWAGAAGEAAKTAVAAATVQRASGVISVKALAVADGHNPSGLPK